MTTPSGIGTSATPAPGSPAGGGPRRRVLSIRWIITAGAVLLTTSAVLSVGFVSEHNARGALTRELESRTLLLARNLALTSAGALLGDFPELTLQPVVREMLARQPELAFVTVIDHRGVIQGDADPRRLATPYRDPPGLVTATDRVRLAAGESLRANRDLLVAQVPVRQSGGGDLGTAYVGLRRSHIEGTLAASRGQQGLVLLVLVLLGVGAAFVLMSQLLRPVAALRAGIERIARGDLDTPIRLRDRTEMGLLADTVDEMAAGLKRAQAEMIERERLAHEVDLARQLQRSLLPEGACALGAFTVRGDHRAAAEVGGDYFDVLRLRDGRVGLAVADVSGKGLAGCLVMSMLSALLRALRETCTSPSDMLAALDERLGESLAPGVFVTMFYGVLDPASGRLTWASAGHNPPLVWRRATGRLQSLPARGIPLAAIHGGAIRSTLEDAELTLEPGDLFVQYTDGYTEAFAPDGSQFGLERVRDVVTRTAPDGCAGVIGALVESLADWRGARPPADDETLLVVEAEAVAPAPAGVDMAFALDQLQLAQAAGRGLTLPARLDDLQPLLRDWLAGLDELGALSPEETDWLVSALYELCANVVEHGYDHDERRSMELWWLATREREPASAGSDNERSAWHLRKGGFVLRDDGLTYRPDAWRESDFSDPGVRRRGRGIGLDIVHRVMREVAYHPSTPRGNITLLTFGPRPRVPSGEGVVS